MQSLPPITRNLLIANVVCFILQELAKAAGTDLTDIFGLHFVLAENFGIWQLVSYMFLHGGIAHLFFNMFSLWMFGGLIERTLGRNRFLLYYFICGVGAGGMAWSQLERWKRHQGLVAEGWGAKRLHAQFHAAHYQWMGGADMRGAQAEGACFDG